MNPEITEKTKLEKIKNLNFSWKKIFSLIILFFIILALPILIIASTMNQKNETRTHAAESTIDSLTTQSLENNSKRNIAATKLLLGQRQKMMNELAYNNPTEFLAKVMSSDVRNTFPAEQQSLIEEKTTMDGDLLPFHKDEFKNDKKISGYYFQKPGILYRVSFDKMPNPDSIISARKANLTGYKIDNVIVAKSTNLKTSTEIQTLTATGGKNILVIPVNFKDDRRTPYSQEEIMHAIFGTSSNSSTDTLRGYYKSVSKSKLNIYGDTSAWRQLDIDAGNDFCDNGYGRIKKALPSSTFDGYDEVIFIFPNQKCNWSGMGTIGGNPGFTWLNEFSLRVSSHEIGHNLGINHASLQNCTAYGCSISEYGDLSDPMGYQLANMNGLHLSMLGFENKSIIKDFNSDGIFTLYKQGSDNSPQILKIDNPNLSWDNYLEFRSDNKGYDNKVPYNLATGILIYSWNGNPAMQTRLINITPKDTNRYNLVLTDGKKVKLSNVTIRMISHTKNYAKVEIYKN